MLRALFFLLAALVAACDPPHDAPSSDGGLPAVRYVLERDDAGVIALGHGETAQVAVMLRTLDGEPVAGRRVTFLLEGSFHDSGLMVLEDTTDEEGHAQTVVRSGFTNSLFRLRISTEEAAPIAAYISVSDSGFGEVDFSLDYEGERAIERYGVGVYFGADCDDPRVLDPALSDLETLLDAGASETSIDKLPGGASYAFAGRAFDEAGVLIAGACVDAIVVYADDTVEVAITVSDLPFTLSGTYELTIALSPESDADALGAAGEAAVLQALGPQADEEAAYLLDAVVAALTAEGQADVVAAIAAERAALEQSIATALSAAGVGPHGAAADARAAIAAELSELRLVGTLGVASAASAGERLAPTLNGLSFGATPTTPVDVTLAELALTVTASATSTLVDTEGSAALGFTLPEGLLARAALLAAARRGSEATPEAWARTPVGADALLAHAPLTMLGAHCNDSAADCVTRAIEATADAFVADFTEGLRAATAHDTLAVDGTLSFGAPDATRATQSIEAEVTATLSGGGLASVAWPATLSGTR